jgi:H+-transporting ATPase
VVRGETEATVAYTGKDTFLGKTAAMLNGQGSGSGSGGGGNGNDETSNLQKLLVKIMAILVVLSISLCSICFAYLLRQGEEIRMALSFTVRKYV